MGSKYRRLVARGRIAAIPVMAAAAVTGGVLGVTNASAKRVGHAARAAVSAKELAQLKTVVTKAETAPSWKSPGAAVSAKVLKGKKLLVFPINSEIGACETQARDFKKLGDALGANVTLDSASGPPQWDSNIEQAASGHYAGLVMLCGVEPPAVQTQLSAAHAAGVKIVDGNYNETNDYAGLDGETAVNTNIGMKDDLADALINLKGKAAHVLFVDSPSVIQYAGAKAGLQAAMKKWCPSSCKLDDEVDVQVQDWATPTEQSDVASALTAHPDINTVIIAFDGMTPSVVSALTGHSGVKIYTWGGSSSVEAWVKQGKVASDVDLDERWDAYDAMDQIIRLLSGKKAAPVTKEVDPNVLVTRANAATFQLYSDKGYDHGAFIRDFDKLWGVKK